MTCAAQGPQARVVALLAAAGLPSLLAGRLREKLPQALSNRVSAHVPWQVVVKQHCWLKLDEDGVLPFQHLAAEHRA